MVEVHQHRVHAVVAQHGIEHLRAPDSGEAGIDFRIDHRVLTDDLKLVQHGVRLDEAHLKVGHTALGDQLHPFRCLVLGDLDGTLDQVVRRLQVVCVLVQDQRLGLGVLVELIQFAHPQERLIPSFGLA